MCVITLVGSCSQGISDDYQDISMWKKAWLEHADNTKKFKYWSLVGSPTWGVKLQNQSSKE